jgi:hypothetical protein
VESLCKEHVNAVCRTLLPNSQLFSFPHPSHKAAQLRFNAPRAPASLHQPTRVTMRSTLCLLLAGLALLATVSGIDRQKGCSGGLQDRCARALPCRSCFDAPHSPP